MHFCGLQYQTSSTNCLIKFLILNLSKQNSGIELIRPGSISSASCASCYVPRVHLQRFAEDDTRQRSVAPR